jgi:hypothetical protein
MEAPQNESILDSIENDDCEMAGNLGRLNVLLDQLNGLLHGGREAERGESKNVRFDDDWPIPLPGSQDFSCSDELEKFFNLPPISNEELVEADWESLFKRIQSDSID